MSQLYPREMWQGRVDAAESGFAQRWHQVMQFGEGEPGGLVLLGFACDAGVIRNQGRSGAAEGPRALRKALANVPLGRTLKLADRGDIVCIEGALEEAQTDYAQTLAGLLASGRRVIGLGGGHEIAYAGFCGLHQALSRKLGAGKTGQNAGQNAGQSAGQSAGQNTPPRIGIINFDAHFDLRGDERASSGTPFRQIAEHCAAQGMEFNYRPLGISRFANTQALFERARTLGVRWREDCEMSEALLPQINAELDEFLEGVDAVHLTLCLDVLPPGLAPGVSAPAARGVGLEVIEPLIDRIAASGKLAYAEFAELNPHYDIDQHTARVAARLVARVAEGWA